MRLSRQTNISVRTLVYCAVNEPNLSRVPEIAKAFGVTDMFLFKIILPVAKQGLLETIRGRKGGIRLSRPAEEIVLSDVLRLTEDNFELSECFGAERDRCAVDDRSVYTVALRRALDAFFSILDEYTIADLAADPAALEIMFGIDKLDERPAPRRAAE